jgi:NAD-dependent dihydropyrimidine dehydrogenase PreA subunit
MPPKIKEGSCTGCGRCENICSARVYELVDKRPNVKDPDECTECGVCVDECPVEAIELD